jgi:hypothetical protein
MHSVNWPTAKFKSRRPDCCRRIRSTGIANIRAPHSTGSNFERAGKDPKDDTVSASRQAELRGLTDADVVRLAQQGDAVAFERIHRLHSRKVAAWILVGFQRPFPWLPLLGTNLIPVVPFVIFFDVLISWLRAYSLGEPQKMTSGLEGSG